MRPLSIQATASMLRGPRSMRSPRAKRRSHPGRNPTLASIASSVSNSPCTSPTTKSRPPVALAPTRANARSGSCRPVILAPLWSRASLVMPSVRRMRSAGWVLLVLSRWGPRCGRQPCRCRGMRAARTRSRWPAHRPGVAAGSRVGRAFSLASPHRLSCGVRAPVAVSAARVSPPGRRA